MFVPNEQGITFTLFSPSVITYDSKMGMLSFSDGKSKNAATAAHVVLGTILR